MSFVDDDCLAELDEEKYEWLDPLCVNTEISHSAFRIASVMVSSTEIDDRTCRLSIDEIARRSFCSRPTVVVAISSLKRIGAISEIESEGGAPTYHIEISTNAETATIQ